jgi:hypothetical protein
VPGGELWHIVFSQQKKKPRCGPPFTECFHGIHGETGPLAFQFEGVNEKAGFFACALSKHGQPVLCRSLRGRVELVRVDPGWNKDEQIEGEFLERILRQQQMAVVYGVEASSKKGDAGRRIAWEIRTLGTHGAPQ